MSMIRSGVTKATPGRIAFGAGVYFSGVSYDEKVAPTEEEMIEKLIGATQDGGSLAIAPEFFRPSLDGVLVNVAELTTKVAETAQIEVSMAELTPDSVANTVIGKVNETTDKKYDVITSSKLQVGHFYDGFGFCGSLLDGRPIIIIFKKALCTSGMTYDAKNKTNSVFKGTFECHSDIEYGMDRLPYAIFIYKEGEWQKEKAEVLIQNDPLEVEQNEA